MTVAVPPIDWPSFWAGYGTALVLFVLFWTAVRRI